jgi:anti-sigma-K factor RskA
LARETVEYRNDEPRPSEQVWSRIAAELDLATPAAGGRHAQGLAGGYGDERREPGRPVLVPRPAEAAEQDPGVPTGRHASHRASPGRRADSGRRWARAAVALTAAAAVGVLGTLVAVRPWQEDSSPQAVAGSTASLTPVAGAPGGASGRAVVVQGETGPELDVTTVGLPAQAGYYEVWVYDGERDMVSVGVLGADTTAAFALPPTLDLRRFHVVDISVEEYDGDQTHSAVSVLRGSLTG